MKLAPTVTQAMPAQPVAPSATPAGTARSWDKTYAAAQGPAKPPAQPARATTGAAPLGGATPDDARRGHAPSPTPIWGLRNGAVTDKPTTPPPAPAPSQAAPDALTGRAVHVPTAMQHPTADGTTPSRQADAAPPAGTQGRNPGRDPAADPIHGRAAESARGATTLRLHAAAAPTPPKSAAVTAVALAQTTGGAPDAASPPDRAPPRAPPSGESNGADRSPFALATQTADAPSARSKSDRASGLAVASVATDGPASAPQPLIVHSTATASTPEPPAQVHVHQAAVELAQLGGGTARVTLHPPTLGTVMVQVALGTGGAAHIQITATTPDGYAALAASSAALHQQLTQSGIPVASLETHFQGGGQQENASSGQQRRDEGDAPARRSAAFENPDQTVIAYA